jgi:FAD/FMN-containing dehydrogenase
MSPGALLAGLRAALGTDAVLTPSPDQPAALDAYLVDWRKRYQGKALAVVRPANTAEVAATVSLCAAHGVTIVPQGGNTSLVGGSIPDDAGQQIVLSLNRLNKVLGVDAANLSMTVQAGCLLADVQKAADEAGLLFPLSLAAEGSCTIGGNLATNAGGTQVLRYGTARELCLGLEAVSAQGLVWDGLKSLRKDNTGYDLRDLLIGSEGTLGIITAASLRLYPRPASRQAALVAVATLDQALALLTMARRQLDASLTGFELMHRYPLSLLARHLPDQARVMQSLAGLGSGDTTPVWTILLDAASSQSAPVLDTQIEDLLGEALVQGVIQGASLARNQTQYRAMWALREAIPLAERVEAMMVKHDIAVPTSRVPEFVSHAEAALGQHFPGCRVVCFGHLGDGNLHFNVQAPEGASPAAFLADHEHAVNNLVYDLAQRLGGTISAEHGIGQLKREALAQRQNGVGTLWMRAIKQALDPAGTLNPSRLVP